MRRSAVFTMIGVCAAALGARTLGQSQVPAGQAPPVFRASVDLTQVDVSVLDKNHRPVRGLTAADFVVREDGDQQSIDTFAAIDLPDAVVSPPSPTVRTVPSDVFTNQLDNHRLFVIVMDDATLENNVDAVARAKAMGHSVIDKLGPTDLTSVVFTGDNRNTQNFTSDKAKLYAAVDLFGMGSRGMGDITNDPSSDGLFYANSIHVLEEVAHYLIGAPDRRKALIYIGQGVPVDHNAGEPILIGRSANPQIKWREMQLDLIEKMKQIFLQAQRANVAMYMMDACGLRASGGDPYSNTCQPGLEVDYLQTVASNTGGRAVVNTSSFEAGITQMFVENSSYYLLGYRRTNPKSTGQYARLDVQVKKSGLTVRARHITYNEKTPEEQAASDHRPPPTPAEVAIGGVLPDRDTPLRATAAPFGLPGQAGRILLEQPAAVAIALGIQEPAPVERVTEAVDLVTMAFTPEGDQRGAQTQTAQVALLPAQPGEQARYELLARIDLPPGRYSLRLGTHNQRTNQSGSVFMDLDVPDFVNAPLTLSGLLLASSSAPVSATAKALESLVPIVPTTERQFPSGATVRGFARVYQGSTATLVPVAVSTRLSDGQGTVVYTDTVTVDAHRFQAARVADLDISVPIANLKPGAYVLTLEAKATSPEGSVSTARRDVPFAVK